MIPKRKIYGEDFTEKRTSDASLRAFAPVWVSVPSHDEHMLENTDPEAFSCPSSHEARYLSLQSTLDGHRDESIMSVNTIRRRVTFCV